MRDERIGPRIETLWRAIPEKERLEDPVGWAWACFTAGARVLVDYIGLGGMPDPMSASDPEIAMRMVAGASVRAVEVRQESARRYPESSGIDRTTLRCGHALRAFLRAWH